MRQKKQLCTCAASRLLARPATAKQRGREQQRQRHLPSSGQKQQQPQQQQPLTRSRPISACFCSFPSSTNCRWRGGQGGAGRAVGSVRTKRPKAAQPWPTLGPCRQSRQAGPGWRGRCSLPLHSSKQAAAGAPAGTLHDATACNTIPEGAPCHLQMFCKCRHLEVGARAPLHAAQRPGAEPRIEEPACGERGAAVGGRGATPRRGKLSAPPMQRSSRQWAAGVGKRPGRPHATPPCPGRSRSLGCCILLVLRLLLLLLRAGRLRRLWPFNGLASLIHLPPLLIQNQRRRQLGHRLGPLGEPRQRRCCARHARCRERCCRRCRWRRSGRCCWWPGRRGCCARLGAQLQGVMQR